MLTKKFLTLFLTVAMATSLLAGCGAGAVRSRQAAQLIQELSAEDAPGLEVTTNSEIDKILREYVKNSGE